MSDPKEKKSRSSAHKSASADKKTTSDKKESSSRAHSSRGESGDKKEKSTSSRHHSSGDKKEKVSSSHSGDKSPRVSSSKSGERSPRPSSRSGDKSPRPSSSRSGDKKEKSHHHHGHHHSSKHGDRDAAAPAAAAAGSPVVRAPIVGPPRVLLQGTTGNTGMATAAALVAQKDKYASIKLGARDTSSEKLQALVTPGVQVVEFNTNEASSMTAAFADVDVAILIPPGATPDVKDRENFGVAVAAALKASTVRHIVLLSVLGTEYEAILFQKQFRSIEKQLEATGIPLTTLELAAFMENFFGSSGAIKQGALYMSVAPTAKWAPVSVADIGVATANVAAAPAAHVGRKYKITGPESLSAEQMAAVLSANIGHTVTYQQVDDNSFRQALLGLGFPQWQAEGLVEMFALINKGAADMSTLDLETLLGRPPLTLAQFAKSAAGAFAAPAKPESAAHAAPSDSASGDDSASSSSASSGSGSGSGSSKKAVAATATAATTAPAVAADNASSASGSSGSSSTDSAAPAVVAAPVAHDDSSSGSSSSSSAAATTPAVAPVVAATTADDDSSAASSSSSSSSSHGAAAREAQAAADAQAAQAAAEAAHAAEQAQREADEAAAHARAQQEAAAAAEQAEREAHGRAEREAHEAKERAEREAHEAKERAEREAHEAKERAEREALEAKEAEAKAERDRFDAVEREKLEKAEARKRELEAEEAAKLKATNDKYAEIAKEAESVSGLSPSFANMLRGKAGMQTKEVKQEYGKAQPLLAEDAPAPSSAVKPIQAKQPSKFAHLGKPAPIVSGYAPGIEPKSQPEAANPDKAKSGRLQYQKLQEEKEARRKADAEEDQRRKAAKLAELQANTASPQQLAEMSEAERYAYEAKKAQEAGHQGLPQSSPEQRDDSHASATPRSEAVVSERQAPLKMRDEDDEEALKREEERLLKTVAKRR